MDEQYKKDNSCTNFCDNFHNTIEFIGKRWMGIIIYNLLNGPKRFHELSESIPGISDRLLTERLRDLEKQGIIVKKVSPSSPRKVEYELTSIGKEFENVFRSILNWIQLKEEQQNT
ncbi:winged helix-turn-helix transcriptional regulator [Bacillus massiliigorillae]|uniref:winged helix-turn-helix transcriptional regulator n=1 Tax=Bacillus massiliigorillae TaxID=1243664 RepID=UPI0003A80F22|nr:helix-turn-helix domain-containing protein [Bacillus massiliigorillae]